MTVLPHPTAFFAHNPISRAEHTYQQRSARPLSRWRRWLNRLVMLLGVTVALILFGGLLAGALSQRDPLPIAQKLNPLPNLLLILAASYHLLLMFQTISLSANSISREKEAQTWDMLVLTGIDARQIVRGKWWATVQRQYPAYLLLGLLRIGAVSGLALGFGSFLYYASGYYYNQQIQLPHPLTIVFSAVLGMGFTLANLGFSAACGVLASASSKRSPIAIARGFGNQILLSLVIAIGFLFIVSRLMFVNSVSTGLYSVYSILVQAVGSLIDNGLTLTTSPLYVDYFFNGQNVASPIEPLAFDWIIAGLLSLLLYAFCIWFTLWRAEKRAVAAMATPVKERATTTPLEGTNNG